MNLPEVLKKYLNHHPEKSSREILLTWLNALYCMRDNLKPEEWKGLLRFYMRKPQFSLDNVDAMYQDVHYSKHPVVKEIWLAKQDVMAFKRFAEKNETREEGVFHMEP